MVLAIAGGAVVWLNLNKRYDNNSPLRCIPSSALAVMKVNGADFLRSRLDAADYRADIRYAEPVRQLRSSLSLADSVVAQAIMQQPNFGNRTLYISQHGTGDAISTLYALQLNSYMEGRNIMSALEEDMRFCAVDTVIGGAASLRLQLPPHADHFAAVGGGCLFLTADAELLSQVLQGTAQPLHDDACFSTLERTASSTASMSLFFNLGATDSVQLGSLSRYQLANIGKWVELDIDLSRKSIVANGFLSSHKATLATSLAGQKSKDFTIDNHIPSGATSFISYSAANRGLSDEAFVKYLGSSDAMGAYRKAQESIFEHSGIDVEAQLSQVFAGELALFTTSASLSDTANACLVLKADNGTIAQAALNSIIGTLHGIETPPQCDQLSPVPSVTVPVFRAFGADDNLFFLDHLFPYVPRNYYIRYENTILIADRIDVLRRTLYENLLNRTYGSDADFRNFRASFSSDNVFFAFCNSVAIKNFVTDGGLTPRSPEYLRAMTRFYGLGLQMSSLNGMPYVTASAMYEPARIEMPPTAWQSRLDTVVIGRPFAVVNHNTQETEFMVQDAAYNIYLINPKGLVLWKRMVDGPILGDVTQIDYYNNRKLQYLFATANSIHLIDRNGNNTASFPIHLPNKAVSGVTYIDYGNPKEFRLFVACDDKTICLYDRECQRIQGWEMQKTEGYVRKPIDHWVTGNRDYLIMSDDYRCYITDRRGNERVPLAPLAPNADSKVYLVRSNTPQAAFVTSTADGKMATITVATGNITTTPIDGVAPDDMHVMLRIDNARSFAFVTKNRIVITDENGSVMSMQNTYLSSIGWATVVADKYIAVWDKDENLGYLFDQNGHMLEGYPVPAWGAFTVLPTDKLINIVVAGKDGSLFNYLK